MTQHHLAAWIAVLLLSALPLATAAAASSPNIIFILTDDQGYGDLSCHGNPILKTPHIDRLYTESVRFTDFQVSPICSPTRCALMTGRHEYRSGVFQTRGPCQNMSLQATTIASVLQDAGYATGLFGKWHLGHEDAYLPHNRGFDLALSFPFGMITEGNQRNKTQFDCVLLRNGVKEKTQGFCTDVFFNESMQWIDSIPKNKPFFAFISTNAPHKPLACPEKNLEPYLKTAPNKELATYFGMISNIDDNVGRLMSYLKAKKLEDNTLLIFTSDNGANAHFKQKPSPIKFYNAGMKGSKGSVEEGGTRVPSFWRLPGRFPADTDIHRLAAAIDVFPTFAALAGAEIPKGLTLDGQNLLPLLENPKANSNDRFVFLHKSNWGGEPTKQANRGFAVRNQRFRLVEGSLFDIQKDRGQNTDIAKQHPEVVKTMRTAYNAWWQEVQPVLDERYSASNNK